MGAMTSLEWQGPLDGRRPGRVWPRPEGELRERVLWLGVCLCACKLLCVLLQYQEAAVVTTPEARARPALGALLPPRQGVMSRADTSSFCGFHQGPGYLQLRQGSPWMGGVSGSSSDQQTFPRHHLEGARGPAGGRGSARMTCMKDRGGRFWAVVVVTLAGWPCGGVGQSSLQRRATTPSCVQWDTEQNVAWKVQRGQRVQLASRSWGP